MQSRRRQAAPYAQNEFKFWQVTAQVAVIAIAVALVYLPAFRADFVWDDEQLVTGNPLLRTFSGLAEIWSGGRTPDYFPITNTVFWIEYHIFGEKAAGYHAVNVVLQAADALLVWLVLRRLSVPGAWLAGLIFGIHPLHAESVAWISELKNVLAMLFALLSALFFLQTGEKRLLAGRAGYAVSLFFFLLALLAKTQVVFLPVALLLCGWWRSRSRTNASFRREVIRTGPFFLIAAVLSVVTIWFQNRGIGGEEIVIGSFARRLVNAAMAIWWYAGKVFVPARLMSIYQLWRFDSPEPLEWLPLIAILGLVALLWWWRDHGTGGPFFAIVYFIVALLPVLGFVRMAYLRSGTLVADHLQYFGDVSLIALVGAAVTALWGRGQRTKFATGFLVTLLLAATGTYTFNRAAAFHDEETLWEDNLSKNPDAWQAHVRLGQRLFKQERYAEALFHLERTVQLKPELADNHNLLGLDYCRLNRFEEGIAEYRKALQLKEAKSFGATSSGVATIRTNLANALTISANHLSGSGGYIIPDEAMRRYEEAIRQYEKALELQPQHPAIHRNLGMLLAKLGRYDEAEAHLRATLEVVPDEPAARATLEEIEAKRH